MKRPVILAVVVSCIGGAATAGPLEGISQQVDRNPAMEVFTSGADGQDYARTNNNVLLGSDTIGVQRGKGGENASDKSVVGPWVSTGCTSGTRIDLPGGGGGSGC